MPGKMQHIRLLGLYIPFVPAYTEYRNMEKGRIRLKLLVFVLDKVENLEPVLNKFEHIGIKGATILESKGMARALESYFDGSFLGSLLAVMEPDREDNRTVFAVLKEEDVPRALAAIEEVNGSFDEPGTGVAFTLPVDDVRGLHKNY